jgi:hypothetical protein
MQPILTKQMAYNEFLLNNRSSSYEKMDALSRTLKATNAFMYGGENPDMTAVPFVLDEKELNHLAGISERLLQLILSLPERIFRNDLAAYAQALHVPKNRLELYSRTFGDNRALAARADVLLSSEGWRFVELNVSGVLGGIDIGIANRLALELDFFKGFCDLEAVAYRDPAHALSKSLKALADRSPIPAGHSPQMLIMEWSRWLPGIHDHYECIRRLLLSSGFDITVCDENAVSVEHGKLWQDGRPVDIILRSFQSFDSDSDLKKMTEYMDLHRQGGLVCYAPSHAELFMSKSNFALLWNPSYQKHFNADERSFIENYVPETHQLQHHDVLQAHKNDFIVKAADSWGGEGVYPGWEYDDAAWVQLLASLENRGSYVMQRRVQNTPIVMPHIQEGVIANIPLNVVWGPLLIDGAYAGMFTRSLPMDRGSVVNGAKGAALGTVFTLS